MPSSNPVLVEINRGTTMESAHRGAFAIADSAGAPVASAGDVTRPVFPRSAIKPIQALPLLESGAAEAFAVTDAEVALACASHGGEPGHTEAVAAWLARLGRDEAVLECGSHVPMYTGAADDLVREGQEPCPLHNNCSGKHTGFVATALHLGEDPAGYVTPGHPVQQRLKDVLGEICGEDLSDAPSGTDGCAIPTIGVSLVGLARGMARFARPDGAGTRADAMARIRRSMAAHPFLIAGTGRYDTEIMKVTGEEALVKTGAEGVYCAMLPGLGLGVALKVDDGATRASEAVMTEILRRLRVLDADRIAALGDTATPVIRNRKGEPVGAVRPASGWADALAG